LFLFLFYFLYVEVPWWLNELGSWIT
jgi:hypothetical protein